MPKENRFETEYAKSSMATCRVCMAKIPKEALRIGHSQLDADAGGPPMLENDASAAAAAEERKAPEDKRLAVMAGATRWHHFECFPNMKGAKWMAANLPKEPKSLVGFGKIKKADQKKLTQLWKAIQGGFAKAAKGGKSEAVGADGAKRKAPSSSSSKGTSAKKARRGSATASGASAEMAKLTSPQGVLSAKDHRRVRGLEQELASSTTAKLQAELELNKQVRAGKKGELVQRVAEGRVLGALPTCPRCSKGRIHWSRIGGWHSCPGYYDKDAGMAKRCYFRSKEMKRGKWKSKK